MDAKQAAALSVGDCVTWDGDASDRGRVTATGYRALEVTWGPGEVALWLHINDCERLGVPDE